MRVKPMGIAGLLLILIFLISVGTVLAVSWRCRANRCVKPSRLPPTRPVEPLPVGAPPTPLPTPAELDDLIYVEQPVPNSLVASPLVVTGAARGSWYFEASFPIRLLDGNGREVAVLPAQAQGEWMTTEYVPFLVRLEFSPPATPTGTLVLEKDNPSGLPEHAQELRVPIRFR